MELTVPDTVSPGAKFNLQNSYERTDAYLGALSAQRKNLLMKFFSEAGANGKAHTSKARTLSKSFIRLSAFF